MDEYPPKKLSMPILWPIHEKIQTGDVKDFNEKEILML